MSLGEAQTALETAKRMVDQPGVADAFRSGSLSVQQAASVSRAVEFDPTAESVLLAHASGSTLKQFRSECRHVEANSGAAVELERHNRIHKNRHFRHWIDHQTGAFKFIGEATPENGARILAELEPVTERIFREARRQGLREPRQAYRFDAFLELITGARSETSGPKAQVQVMVSYDALKRGYTARDESCEIAGVGPVPVATARAMMSDCILKVLVTRGDDVCAVAGAGRTIPASVRTALIARDRECVVPHCDVSHGLEMDHYRIDYADNGPSRLDNLARLCKYHHSMKTYRGFRLGGGPGRWEWEGPATEASDTG